MSCVENRLACLAEAFNKLGANCAYIRDTPTIEWVSGFRGVFDDEQAHALFLTTNLEICTIHTDSRYVTAMENASAKTPFKVDSSKKTMEEWAHDVFSEARNSDECAHLAIENSITLSEYRALTSAFSTDISENKCRFIETNDVSLKVRTVKDEYELELMRQAQSITDNAFDHILGFIKPGRTEREIQLELDSYMLTHGANSLSFPSIVASGKNGASPHALVSDKQIETAECIVLDFGARRAGYCSDMTRTVFVGKPSLDMRRAWDTLRRANETVEEKLSCNMTGSEAHALAESILAEGGFAGRMGHGLGHGVGVQVHELPVLSPRNEEALVCGNVVTVEPGIYIPSKFGMRLEDCGVITEHGYEPFTQSTHEMVVI